VTELPKQRERERKKEREEEEEGERDKWEEMTMIIQRQGKLYSCESADSLITVHATCVHITSPAGPLPHLHETITLRGELTENDCAMDNHMLHIIRGSII